MSTLITILVLVAAFVALIGIFQRKLIYFPMPRHLPSVESVLPGGEAVSFFAEDGIELHGWFVQARAQARSTVLVFNGNAGNRSFRAPLAEELVVRGHSVLLFDYRGYGENRGRPSEKGLAADARAAVAYLGSRNDVDSTRIVYFGESLGAGVAVGLAAEAPPAALILRSPFTSLADVGRAHYPFLPVRLLLRDRYASLDRIGSIDSPLLIIAGERDSIIPPKQSRALFERAVSGPGDSLRRFVLIPGADHNDWELLVGVQMIGEMERFLGEVLGQG